MKAKTLVNKEMLIGDILQIRPDAKEVIEKYFGGGCFTCPGLMWESLEFGATMHNRNVDDIVNEINKKEG